MIDDIDWDILMKKLDSLGEKIDRLEKMVGIVKQPSYPVPSIYPNDSSKVKPMTSEDWYKVLQNTPCAFDSIPPEDKMKPMGLSCGCPKCSPYCMEY